MLSLVMNDVPPGEIEAFLAGWPTRDFKEDKEFVLETTKLGPRNRSASQELLDDKRLDEAGRIRSSLPLKDILRCGT